jgi:hypothetical protein
MTVHIIPTSGLDNGSLPQKAKYLIDSMVTGVKTEDCIIITGRGTNLKGYNELEPTEAYATLEYLKLKHPHFIDQVVLEEQAMDTVGNAIFTYRLMEEMGLLNEILVVHVLNYHKARVSYLFDKVFGLEKITYDIVDANGIKPKVLERRIEYEKQEITWLKSELNNLDGYKQILVWMLRSDFAYNKQKIEVDDLLLKSF